MNSKNKQEPLTHVKDILKDLKDDKSVDEFSNNNNGDLNIPADSKTTQSADLRKERFRPLYAEDLNELLGLTIKRDNNNKVITFLCQLSAYSEDSQLNISFNAPSSTGKTYIPGEICKLFPKQDVINVGYCSPTAFFHDHGVFDKDKAGYFVDFSRQILIFLDQPHTLLLQHLTPLPSHDKKEIQLKITDKTQKEGLRTKKQQQKEYPAVT